jgi:aryl-alcohol dehydrogenase-like predicted oxidoreductase
LLYEIHWHQAVHDEPIESKERSRVWNTNIFAAATLIFSTLASDNPLIFSIFRLVIVSAAYTIFSYNVTHGEIERIERQDITITVWHPLALSFRMSAAATPEWPNQRGFSWNHFDDRPWT